MRKRSGQVYSRESSATLQLTVSLLYQKVSISLLMSDGNVIIIYVAIPESGATGIKIEKEGKAFYESISNRRKGPVRI